MYVLELPIIERKQIAKDTAEVSLGLADQTFTFDAGQYIRLTVPNPVVPDPRGNWRDFVIASSPDEKDVLRVAFRVSPSGVKRSLLELPLGSKVSISGPHGTDTLPRDKTRPLVFVAGGIGITAFIGKILLSEKNHFDHNITLLWGEREEKRASYLPLLEEIEKRSGGKFRIAKKIGGAFDAEFLRAHIGDPAVPLWHIAGPPAMVLHLKDILKQLGVPEKNIAKTEYVGGGKAEDLHAATNEQNIPLVSEDPSEKKRFYALLDALNKTAIVSETDADGNIVFVNDKFVEISRYSREELTGQNHRLLKSGYHSAAFYKNLWKTISRGKIWRGEVKNMAKDGSMYWMDTSIAPIMGGRGKPIKYISVRFNISEQKDAESELSRYRHDLETLVSERTDALAKANASLSQEIAVRKQLEESLRARAEALSEGDERKNKFLALLSHELRNPLAPIISSIEAAKLHGIKDPEISEAFATIERQTKHLGFLMRDLLDVARINTGKIVLRREIVDLRTILDHSLETSRPFIKRFGHTLDVTYPAESLRIHADPMRLEQIIVNVLNNSAKYTEPGGHISLTAAREGNDAVISIRDSGIGITTEMLPRLFTEFMQEDQPRVRQKGGLGLGLMIVKTLMEMHGGTVTAMSEGAGKGSEFILRIPLHTESEAREETNYDTLLQAENAEKTRKRILVADDNQDLANALGKLLRLLGHEVKTAYSGREAVALSESFKPEIVFMDIAMPGMDGYEAARKMRESGMRATLVALTGYGQDKDRVQAVEAGFSHHLVKPIGLEEIERILSGEATPLSKD